MKIREVHTNRNVTHIKISWVTAQSTTPLTAVRVYMAEVPRSITDLEERKAEKSSKVTIFPSLAQMGSQSFLPD